MYNTPVYLVSPVCQCCALMSKGCINKALVGMSLCPSMTTDREESLHEWLKEVSVPRCSSLVTKPGRNRRGATPAPRAAGLSREDRGLTACGGSARGRAAVRICPDACVSCPPCCTLQILGYFDYAFTAIFTVEILLKVMAFSLILTYSKAAVAIIVATLCLPSRC